MKAFMWLSVILLTSVRLSTGSQSTISHSRVAHSWGFYNHRAFDILWLYRATPAEVKKALAQGADPNAPVETDGKAFKQKWPPLFFISSAGVAHMLIKGGAKVNALDRHSVNALRHAVGDMNIPLVKELLRSGIAVNRPDSFGHTTYQWLLLARDAGPKKWRDQWLPMMRLLKEHGAR
jgi:ankyrin repeat protein